MKSFLLGNAVKRTNLKMQRAFDHLAAIITHSLISKFATAKNSLSDLHVSVAIGIPLINEEGEWREFNRDLICVTHAPTWPPATSIPMNK